MSDERKGWAGTMEKVNACGHTNAQHMYYEEKVLELDGAACPLVQAAILAERERLAKAQDKRAAELDDDADFYHRKGDAHESIERRVRARERKFVADAIRRGEGV